MPLSTLTPAVLATPLDAASTTVASAYAAGSVSLTVVDGTPFGSPTPAAPVRLTCFRGPDPALLGTYPRTHLRVTGVVGNVLAIAGTMDGYSALSLHAGDVVAVTGSAGGLADIHAAIAAMSAKINELVAALNAIG